MPPELTIRGSYVDEYNARSLALGKKYPDIVTNKFEKAEFDRAQQFNRLLLLENKMACIPHR
jgi:hypothetical protein